MTLVRLLLVYKCHLILVVHHNIVLKIENDDAKRNWNYVEDFFWRKNNIRLLRNIRKTFDNWKYQCTIKLIYYGHNDSLYNLTWILILNDIVTTSICTLSILAYKHTIKITMNLVARWKYWSMKHCLSQTDSQPDLFSMFSELNLFRLERFCF